MLVLKLVVPTLAVAAVATSPEQRVAALEKRLAEIESRSSFPPVPSAGYTRAG